MAHPNPTTTGTARRIVLFGAALALVAAACGGGGESAETVVATSDVEPLPEIEWSVLPTDPYRLSTTTSACPWS